MNSVRIITLHFKTTCTAFLNPTSHLYNNETDPRCFSCQKLAAGFASSISSCHGAVCASKERLPEFDVQPVALAGPGRSCVVSVKRGGRE